MEMKSFYELIDCKIQIPPYQRDYAHGRLTPQAEEIRKTLIKKFADVLSSPDETMSFDFIYGYEEGDHFIPVDGQQRLTTLFLLHLYLSKKANAFEERLSNFTYTTRQFTREFCEKITNSETLLWTDKASPLNFIPNQAWFYSRWERDPSIMGMIRVLDQIHQCFSDRDCKKCWDRLKGAAITFGIPDQSKIGPSEKTYLKMNSRYLQLDDFENFKAHFEKYLSKRTQGGILIEHQACCNDWEKMPFHKKVIWKFDKDWGIYFWRKERTDFSKRFMILIARVFSCFAVLNDDKDNLTFFNDLASGKKSFVSFAPFEKTLQHKEDKYLGFLFSFLDNLTDPRINLETLVDPPWDEQNFDFLSPVNDKFRVVLGGVILFGKITNIADFSEWMRIVWNIAANMPDLKALLVFEKLEESKQELIPAIAMKYDPAKYWSPDDEKGPTLLECQFNHEFLKAKILQEKPELRTQILELERQPFFHGDISVQLFHTNDPLVWQSRARKLEEYSQNNCAFLKDILLHLKDHAQLNYCFMQGKTPFIYDAECYHRLIRSSDICQVIAEMLDGAEERYFAWDEHHKPTVRRICQRLAKEATLDVFIRNGYKEARLQWKGDRLYLHQPYARDGYYLLNSPLYDILDWLEKEEKIKIPDNQRWAGIFHYDPVSFLFNDTQFGSDGAAIWVDGYPREPLFAGGENPALDFPDWPACEFSKDLAEKFLECCQRIYDKHRKNLAAEQDDQGDQG